MNPTERPTRIRPTSLPASFLLVFGCAIAASTGCARANAGFGLNDGMTDWTANAYAGEAAKAYDAGTAWTNPAGMVRLQGLEIDNSITFIDPNLALRGRQQFDNAVLTAPQSKSGIDPAITVGGAGVLAVGPLRLGFAIEVPYASRLSFTPQDYVGRYQAIDSIPTNVQGLFSAAYAVTRRLSIGGGPVVSYFKDRQSHAIALPYATLQGASIGPLVDPAGQDPVAQFRGDDLRPGYDIGALYQVDAGLRFGVNYHSAVYHRLQGYQTVFIPSSVTTSPLAPVVVPSIRAQITDAYVKVPLPGWVDTSFYWQATPQWALMGNATWTDWSLLQHERVNAETPGVPVTTDIQQDNHDTVTAGMGVNFTPRWQRRLMLQGGATYDQSPIDDDTRQASIPDGTRVEVGIGATWRLGPLATLNIAYAHYFFPYRNGIDSGVGDQVTASPLGTVTVPSGRVIGHYDISNDVLSLGVKSSF